MLRSDGNPRRPFSDSPSWWGHWNKAAVWPGVAAVGVCFTSLAIAQPAIADSGSGQSRSTVNAAVAPAVVSSTATQLGLSGPATLDETGRRWSALQGTVHQFGHFLLESGTAARDRSPRSAPALPPKDLRVTVSSATGRASLVREQGGWVLQVDTRGLKGGTLLPLTLNAASTATGKRWQRAIVVEVLVTQVQHVQVPASGMGVNLGALQVAFSARDRSAATMPVAIRWAPLPWAAATAVKVEPGPNATTVPPFTLRPVSVGSGNPAAPQTGTITEALDATVPYAADDANLGTLWRPFQACYIYAGEMRLPASDGNCVWSQSGELTGLLSKAWTPADWSNVTPVLFVHGFTPHEPVTVFPYLGGGRGTFGNFPNLVRQFVGSGGRRFAPFEYRWNSDAQFVQQAQELVTAINTIYDRTGKPVVVVAHSFGGLLTRAVLQQMAAGKKGALASARQRVSALLTLGTPHAGIADTETTLHGVAFPVGQDSGLFEGCSQVSCHVAGEYVLYSEGTRARLGISNEQGEDAAGLFNTRSQLPAIWFAQGIGNVQDWNYLTQKWTYGTGDDLIALYGQRLFPDDRGRDLRQWSVEPDSGVALKEQLLGLLDGVTRVAVGDVVPKGRLAPGDPWARAYYHYSGLGYVTEAYIPAETATACDQPATCQHASWRLLKELLGVGGKLNDTGQTVCVDPITNAIIACAGTWQDGESGRDVTASDASDGKAGFSYVKISDSGAELPATATTWSCVKDRVSGLMWEVKTDDGGLRDKDNIYTNWGDGRTADASAFVLAVNASGLCGYKDWRLPNPMELQGLVDYGKPDPGPTIDTGWFPHSEGWLNYWTGSNYAAYPSSAWIVNFGVGYVRYDLRVNLNAVRLVRAGH